MKILSWNIFQLAVSFSVLFNKKKKRKKEKENYRNNTEANLDPNEKKSTDFL